MSANTITKVRKWAGRFEFTVLGEHTIGEVDEDDVKEYRLYLDNQMKIVDDYLSRERPKD